MLLLDHPEAFAAALLVAALAFTALVAGITEPPPGAPLPRTAAALGGFWALAFLAGAADALLADHALLQAGLLLAAAELAAGGAIWVARSRDRRDGPGDDSGGGGDDLAGGPSGPSGLQVPDEWWERWEESLREPAGAGAP